MLFLLADYKNCRLIKKLKRTIRVIVGIILGVYIGMILLLNLPFVQRQMSVWVSAKLSSVLGSELSIGQVYMGLLNRIIINDLHVKDLAGEDLLKVARLSAKFDLLPLLEGRISISNIQLFGFTIQLNKKTPEDAPNFQFIIDAFTPKEEKTTSTDLDLRINSLLIRRGTLSYDVLSERKTPGKFNANHIKLDNIIAGISLKAIRNDSINAAIKRLSVDEANSGFELKKLSLQMIGNDQQMRIKDFEIALPHTSIQTDTIRLQYDSIGSLRHFTDGVNFSFRMKPSRITLQDLSAFVPAFGSFRETLQTEIIASGSLNNLKCSKLSLSSPGRHFYMQGDASLQDLSQPDNAYVFANLSRWQADREGVSFLLRNFGNNTSRALQNLGNISFRGELSGYFTDLVTYGQIRTDLGEIHTDVKISSNKQEGDLAYSGQVQTQDFDLGSMLDNAQLGKISLNLNVDGSHRKQQYPHIILQGLIASIDYSQYTYQNITLDGEYKQGGFTGKMALEDTNGTIELNGSFNTAKKIPTFNFLATIDHVRPHELNLTSAYQGVEFSARLNANFTGGSIDEMNGEINLDSLYYTLPDKTFFLNNFKVAAVNESGKEKSLTISSNFLTGNIAGDYSYKTLPASILNILKRYIPALMDNGSTKDLEKKRKPIQTNNNFYFDLHLYDTELISAILNIPLKIYAHSTIKGYFNDESQRLRVEGYFPRMRYKNNFIESGMFLCENPNQQIHTSLRFTNRKPKGTINIALEAQAQNDSIRTILNWGNNANTTYSGSLSTLTRLIRKETPDSLKRHLAHAPVKAPLKTIIQIHQTDAILNDTLWQIHPSEVVIDSGKIFVNDFKFTHNERHLHIDGTLSKMPEDTIRIDLQDINIGYVFDIADLGVNFQGEATGPAFASGVLSKPVMSTDLFIRNLGLNEGLLGDAQIHGEWHHDVKGIYLDARIREKDIARTHVHGFIYPIKPTSSLDLQIDAEGTKLKFIHHYMRSITSDFDGRVWGNVHFYGKFKALTMEGKVKGDASLKVDVLNTTYNIKDSIFIEPTGLTFRNNRIYDTQGHEGKVNGYLHYQHFKNLEYHFNFNVNNMLVMNTKESPDFPFYGVVYATGNATIAGNANDGVTIDVAMTTNKNTTFTYIKDNVTSAVSNQFINFVDKTPKRLTYDSSLSDYEVAQKELEKEEEEKGDTDIRLNLQIDATPDASMRIIMDPMAGDYISAKGSGNIRTEFFNKGDVKMFGNYRIEQGVYKFSLQEIIRKDFTIQEGSNISFNGSPLDAYLDIQAYYTVNSASLNDLIPNANEYVNQTNVKVNCIMGISGQLTSPDIKLDLELPNEREEVQALVRNYIPDEEQINMQILYLLGIGKFYAPENTGTAQNSNMMSSVLSSTLSGQLNNALSNIINNNNWNIGTNFSTGEGWTDMEFEGMLSGQLLNNRLLINGNFGYRDNPLANTNFVGDFEAEWLVTRSGNIRLKAYNETNDRYFTRTNLTTQGIGIIFKKDFDKWAELLFWKKWKLKYLRNKRIQADTVRYKADSTSVQNTKSQPTHSSNRINLIE